MDTTTYPNFFKARAVPLALQNKVEAHLDKLEAQVVIESQILIPIVPLPNKMVPSKSVEITR